MTETVKEIKLNFDANADEEGSANGSNVDKEGSQSGSQDASNIQGKSLGKLTDGYEKPQVIDEDELTNEEMIVSLAN